MTPFIVQHLVLWAALWTVSAAVEIWLIIRLDRVVRRLGWLGYAAAFLVLTATTLLTGLVIMAFLGGLVR